MVTRFAELEQEIILVANAVVIVGAVIVEAAA
jgi:hypothetical protein